MTVYQRIKKARSIIGISQEEASLRSGVNQKDISLIETGKKKFIPEEYIHFLYNSGIDLNSIYDIKGKDGVIMHLPHHGSSVFNEIEEPYNRLPSRLNEDFDGENVSPTVSPTTENGSFAGRNDGVPLIPIDAMAGWGAGDFQVTGVDIEHYVIPEFRGVDFLIRVKGPSMYPTYSSGDIAACILVRDSLFIQWGKVYVLDSTQGAIIKRLFKAEAEGYIECRSDNASFPPFNIPVNEIRAMAVVHGVIRFE